MVAKALADTKEKKAKIKEQDILEKQKILDSTSGADTPKIETSLQEKEKEVKDKEEKIKEGKKEVEQKKELIHSKEDKIRKLNDEVNAAKKKYEEMLAKASK